MLNVKSEVVNPDEIEEIRTETVSETILLAETVFIPRHMMDESDVQDVTSEADSENLTALEYDVPPMLFPHKLRLILPDEGELL